MIERELGTMWERVLRIYNFSSNERKLFGFQIFRPLSRLNGVPKASDVEHLACGKHRTIVFSTGVGLFAGQF